MGDCKLQRLTRAEQMLLPDELLERARPHPRRKRFSYRSLS
jgi:hypothetical protein